MAFTGTAVVKQVSDQIVRITGVSLAAGATGTIGLAGHTGSTPNVVLPASFKTEHYAYLGDNVPFQDCIAVSIEPAEATSNNVLVAPLKSGTTTGDFRITVSNQAEAASTLLEIYVRFHD